MRVVAAIVLLAAVASAFDNGLQGKPAMGWRSWNCFGGNIDQAKMELMVDKMVDKSRGVSLLEIGYKNVGLDDAYQKCGAGVDGSFHNASGYPIIDTSKFPSMKSMTDYAHKNGMRMGWYANNCICHETQNVASWGTPVTPGKTDGELHYQGDVAATTDFGFDGIKLDGCGEFRNLTYFAGLFNKTGREILIEDCHWGGDGPGDGYPIGPDTPFNHFRTSGDINPSWNSMFGNLQSVLKWQPWSAGINGTSTGPHSAWPYPDMLEVGNMATVTESRSHFGAWCVVSSPLILGFDLNNSDTFDSVYHIITNKDAVAVNQQWAGHPGALVQEYTAGNGSGAFLWGVKPDPSDSTQNGWSFNGNGAISKDGMCIDFSQGSSSAEIQLAKCNGSPSQQFVLESNGNLHMASGNKECFAIYDFNGPAVVTFSCNTGSNELFSWDKSKGTICSNNGYCFASRTSDPSHSGGVSIQVWAKPQPQGSVAIFVINNDNSQTLSMDVDLRMANFTKTNANVYDIWNQKSMGTTKGPIFTTDPIDSHDSRFYIFS